MFGYVKPVPSELLVREYDFYRAVYCGVCQSMQRHTGRLSSLTLTYDSVFYALVRMMLTDTACTSRRCRCLPHPCKGKTCLADNPALEMTARAFAVLAYGKLLDEKADRHGFSRIPLWFASPVLSGAARRAKLPDLLADMKNDLADLAVLEKENCPSLDRTADCTGRMLARFFGYGLADEKRRIAEDIGFHLGRFVALADAAEDFEKDKKKKNYNPLLASGLTELLPETKERLYISLTLVLQALEEAILRLPHDTYIAAGNILKNILYLGLVKRIDFLRTESGEEGERL